MSRLSGKTAIVTGASRGIGAATALKLGVDGAKVVVHYSKNGESAEKVASEIRYAGGKAVTAQCDLADPEQIPSLFNTARQAFGQVDILVNNAGVAELGIPLEKSDLAHYARQFDVNVRGLLIATQLAAAQMGKEGGRIINISSGATRSAPAGSGVYTATKAAVEMLTRCWARELGPRQITVNAVAPGITDTDMFAAVMPEPTRSALIAATPLGRLGTPDDIAQVVAFLASDEAHWITGEIIGATGGL
jgi:3-oxoacyl-[acyl-carrier protein] reductase